MLRSIVGAPPPARRGVGGSLTALPREEWAAVYSEIKDAGGVNAKALEAVESALFVLCFDDEAGGWSPSAANRRVQSTLLGWQPGDRWFDKHQLIVQPDGHIGAYPNGLMFCQRTIPQEE